MRKSSKMMLHACFSRTGSHARGSVLLMVIIVSAILFSSLIFVLVNMNEAQRAHATRMEGTAPISMRRSRPCSGTRCVAGQSATECTILESASDCSQSPLGCELLHVRLEYYLPIPPVSITTKWVEKLAIVSHASSQGGRWGFSAIGFSRVPASLAEKLRAI
jgi:hypothetical protein